MEGEEENSVSSVLKLNDELRKLQNFRETVNQLHDKAASIVLLTVEWQKIEEKFDLARNLFEEKAKELHLIQVSVKEREQNVERKEREYEMKEKELEVVQDLVRQGFEGMQEKHKELEETEEFVIERYRKMKVKKMKLDERKKKLDEKLEGIKEREEKLERNHELLNDKWGELGVRLKGIELKEKELEGMQELLKERFKGIDVREKGIELKEKELEGIQKFVNEKLREIEVREKGIELEEKEMEGIQESTKERLREIGVKEKEVEQDQELVKKILGEIEGRGEKLDRIEEIVKESLREMEVKERRIELKERELEGIQERVKRKEKELDGIKESMKGRVGDVEVKVKECDKLLSELKVKGMQLEKKADELKSKEQRATKRLGDFLVQEKKFEEDREKSKLKEIELKELEIKTCEGIESNEMKFEERCQEFNLKELKSEEQSRKFANTHEKIEPNIEREDGSAEDSIYANVSASVTVYGKALQMFLNEHGCRRNEVELVLRVSSDPAMLVLKAMEGFYPPHLSKGNLMFEEGAVRRSCILLLEQLMRISPQIRPHVKEEARKLAFEWANRMRVDAAHSLEVLGFLQVLATYGLKSDFDSEKLYKYLEFISHHSQAPELFRALGFADQISGFIQILIRKKQLVEAMNFIYAFELVHEFRPGPILNEYLNDSRMEARRMAKRNNSLEAQIEMINKRIADLRIVLRCIEDHKMETELSPEQLEKQIEFWEKENFNRKKRLQEHGYKSQQPNAKETICQTGEVSATTTSDASNYSTIVHTANPTEQVVAVTAPAQASITASSPTTAAMRISPAEATSSSPTTAPPSVTHNAKKNHSDRIKLSQPQNRGRKKRPWGVGSSEFPRKAPFRDPEYVYSEFPRKAPFRDPDYVYSEFQREGPFRDPDCVYSTHSFRQQPTGFFMDQGETRSSSFRFRAERGKDYF